MITRIRTLIATAAGTTVLAAALGATALGVAGPAHADVCWDLAYDGTTDYYYC
ncbi:hypothetical protein [Mycobacterium sp. C31M]